MHVKAFVMIHEMQLVSAVKRHQAIIQVDKALLLCLLGDKLALLVLSICSFSCSKSAASFPSLALL